MKSVLVLRHAKSSWKDPELTDHDRALNKRGKHDARRIGELLRDEISFQNS
jgi:phosphohistidine phosphatase